MLIVTALWVALRTFRLVPDGLVTRWGLELSSTAMVFLFALSLGDRLAGLHRALGDAQKRLGEGAQRDQEREQKYRALFESATDGLLLLADGVVQACNPTAQTLLGRSSADLVGHPLAEFAVAGSPLPSTASTSGQMLEWSCTRPDGSSLAVEMSLSRLPGPRLEVLAIVRDLTERRKAATERQKLEAQLQQSQKMESIGRLAGGVAHDFNNLLTGVLCSAEFALEELPADHPVRTYLQDILQIGQSGAGLVRQLLAFSRKQLISPRVLDPADLVRGLQRMLARLIGEDVELRTVAAGGGCSVRVDPTQAEQILVNLVVNARDAMPRGGTITVETAPVVLGAAEARRLGLTPGDYVALSVTDTGTGISDEVRAHLFEPFFTTKERGRGTGLGLATVWGAVRQNGGGLEVLSKVGQGSTFRVLLPRVAEKEAAEVAVNESVQPPGSELILLVEDERVVREVATRVLSKLGYDVRACADPRLALETARTLEHIPLLLTDLVMPGMSGRELADEVLKVRPATRVLFTTGYTDDEIVRHGVMDRNYELLPKPYTPTELARRVRLVLDQVV